MTGNKACHNQNALHSLHLYSPIVTNVLSKFHVTTQHCSQYTHFWIIMWKLMNYKWIYIIPVNIPPFCHALYTIIMKVELSVLLTFHCFIEKEIFMNNIHYWDLTLTIVVTEKIVYRTLSTNELYPYFIFISSYKNLSLLDVREFSPKLHRKATSERFLTKIVSILYALVKISQSHSIGIEWVLEYWHYSCIFHSNGIKVHQNVILYEVINF